MFLEMRSADRKFKPDCLRRGEIAGKFLGYRESVFLRINQVDNL